MVGDTEMISTCPEFDSIEDMDQWINTTGADETYAYEDAEESARLFLLGKVPETKSMATSGRIKAYLAKFTLVFNRCDNEERNV